MTAINVTLPIDDRRIGIVSLPYLPFRVSKTAELIISLGDIPLDGIQHPKPHLSGEVLILDCVSTGGSAPTSIRTKVHERRKGQQPVYR